MKFKTKRELIEALVPQESHVLDIGFWGQAIRRSDPEWPHTLLLATAQEVYGVDIIFDENELAHPERYQKTSAENFSFDKTFDVIFAGDLIEHVSNPGLFLSSCKNHLKEDGILILTTPNTFNLFNIIQKIFKDEPPVNSDHTFYFNKTVIKRLLEKNDMEVVAFHTVDTFRGWGIKRSCIRLMDVLLQIFTDKYVETMVVVARKI